MVMAQCSYIQTPLCLSRATGVHCAFQSHRIRHISPTANKGSKWGLSANGNKPESVGEPAEKVPEWAKVDSGEIPPWAKGESQSSNKQSSGIPFPVYLVASSLVAIAAVGSIFEYFNGNPIFGVVYPDSPLWAPILGLFSVTGFPTAGYLFYLGVDAANKASEEADREDGFL